MSRGIVMPEALQHARADDERRSRQHTLIKIALAAAVALIVILALILSEESSDPEPAPRAQVVRPVTAPKPETPPPGSLEEAAKQALKTSEEAAQIQSAVLAEQQAMPQAASAVPEETREPVMSRPAVAGADSSGRLVLGQQAGKRVQQSSAAASVAPAARAVPEPVTHGAAPVARVASTSSATSSRISTSPAPPAFLVQAGVFANYGNAEELRNKLAAAGIPAQIESRVQIGPFASKQEAAAAQAKLRALGLDGGMLLPRSVTK